MTDTLAQLVRKKYPGAYDDLSDAALEAKVDAKYPGAYSDLPRTKGSATPEAETKSAWSGQSYIDAAKRVKDWLPVIGGAAGGALGIPGGPPGVIAGATLGGGAGEAFKQLANRATGEPVPPTADAAAQSIARQGAVQGAAEAVGVGVGAVAAKAAPWLMQSAVKPTLTTLKEYGTTAPRLAKTLLENGINVTEHGWNKLQSLLGSTNKEIAALVANAQGQIDKKAVAAEVLPTAARLAKQTNPTKDLATVGETVSEFLDHPVYKGALSPQEAQAMKQGTYQQLAKKYGQLGSAEVETQKALARGLKNEVAAAAPGVAKLNSKDAELMAAADAVERRTTVAGNRDPVGFAWTASHHPATFLAALMDRHPVVKSMLANAMYDSAAAVSKVSPQAIRAAVMALVTDDGAQTHD